MTTYEKCDLFKKSTNKRKTVEYLSKLNECEIVDIFEMLLHEHISVYEIRDMLKPMQRNVLVYDLHDAGMHAKSLAALFGNSLFYIYKLLKREANRRIALCNTDQSDTEGL